MVAALIGLVLIFSMSQVYRLQSTPAWDSFATPVSFYTTTFLLGTLALGVAFVVTYTTPRAVSSDERDQLMSLPRDTLRCLPSPRRAAGIEMLSSR